MKRYCGNIIRVSSWRLDCQKVKYKLDLLHIIGSLYFAFYLVRNPYDLERTQMYFLKFCWDVLQRHVFTKQCWRIQWQINAFWPKTLFMQMRPWQPCKNVNEYFVFLNKSKYLKEENIFNTNKYDKNVLGNDAELFFLLYMYQDLFYQNGLLINFHFVK